MKWNWQLFCTKLWNNCVQSKIILMAPIHEIFNITRIFIYKGNIAWMSNFMQENQYNMVVCKSRGRGHCAVYYTSPQSF